MSSLPALAWLSLGLLSPLLPVLLSRLTVLGLARSLTGLSLLLAVWAALLLALLSPLSTLMGALLVRLLPSGLAGAVLSARAVLAGGLLAGPTLLTPSLLGVLRGIPRLCGLVLWVGTRWLGVLTLRLGPGLGLAARLARRLAGLGLLGSGLGRLGLSVLASLGLLTLLTPLPPVLAALLLAGLVALRLRLLGPPLSRRLGPLLVAGDGLCGPGVPGRGALLWRLRLGRRLWRLAGRPRMGAAGPGMGGLSPWRPRLSTRYLRLSTGPRLPADAVFGRPGFARHVHRVGRLRRRMLDVGRLVVGRRILLAVVVGLVRLVGIPSVGGVGRLVGVRREKLTGFGVPRLAAGVLVRGVVGVRLRFGRVAVGWTVIWRHRWRAPLRAVPQPVS